jgi:hypothetical protein
VHTTLTSIAESAIRSDGRVNHALLNDCAVHGEAVGRGLGGFGGCGGGDQGLKDGVLGGRLLVSVLSCARVVVGWVSTLTIIWEFQVPTLSCSYPLVFSRAFSQA